MSTRDSRTGVTFAVLAMSLVQLGLAASVSLFDQLGPEGAAWLRLTFAAAIVLVLFRPRPSSFDRRSLLAAIGLGVATAGVTLLFMAAAARIPLGVASAWSSSVRWVSPWCGTHEGPARRAVEAA